MSIIRGYTLISFRLLGVNHLQLLCMLEYVPS